MWSLEFGVLLSLECGVWSVELFQCGVWSLELFQFGVWNVEFGVILVWSLKLFLFGVAGDVIRPLIFPFHEDKFYLTSFHKERFGGEPTPHSKLHTPN